MEDMIKRYRKRINRLTCKYLITISPKRKAKLAGEIDEVTRMLHTLEQMRSERETPEGYKIEKIETR